MAIIQMGTRQIDMSAGEVGFDPVPVPRGTAVFPVISAIGVSKLDFGYLQCTYRFIGASFAVELPETYKYYINGQDKSTRVNTPTGTPGNAEIQLVIFPIEIYPGKANPQVFNVSASYNDNIFITL